ncbi:hypothetical protein SVIOM342S_05591 [Streptomyces violaceorubidus]
MNHSDVLTVSTKAETEADGRYCYDCVAQPAMPRKGFGNTRYGGASGICTVFPG